MANNTKPLLWQIILLILLATSLVGCFSVYIFPGEAPKLTVTSEPEHAIVLMQALDPHAKTTPDNQPIASALNDHIALGTTPFEGVIPKGLWQLRVELAGYKPIDFMIDSKEYHNLTYQLHMEKLVPATPAQK